MLGRLCVHNFRCFENFTLDFGGRPSVLMLGKNGAGKSTVLQSLKLLQSIGRGFNQTGSLIGESDFTQQRTDCPMRLELELTLSGKRFHYALAVELAPNSPREARVLDESLSVDGNPVFTRYHSQIQLVGGVAFGLNWHIVALPILEEQAGERAIQDLKAFFATMVLIAPTPANMTGFAEAPSPLLQDDAGNYAAFLLNRERRTRRTGYTTDRQV